MTALTKEDLLDLVLKSFSREGSGVPEAATIEAMVDNFLVAFSHLKESREWILAQALTLLVTAIGAASELVDPNNFQEWLGDHDRSKWRSWPWLQLYLKERLRRPAAVMDELDKSTDRVLELLGDPARTGLWDRRGMVVGHVQSGKTQHYTAVAAKALDAGYKLVIILSGIHENLRQQTQERIEECITGKSSRDSFKPCGVRAFASQYKAAGRPEEMPPDVSSLTSVAGDFGAAVDRIVDVAFGETPVVLVIKKNVSILKNLLKKLRGPEGHFKPMSHPTLVIDDEADHSSVNTADEETDPTKINQLIRKILWACNRVAFVGYTATPYANIFMADEWVAKSDDRNLDQPGPDLFPRAFIMGLEAPSNYIGPDVVFGHAGDESLGIAPRAALPMHHLVKDGDVWLPPRHKKETVVGGTLPASLTNALASFVLSVAARAALGAETAHCSMLIHVTRFNAVQEQVMAQARTWLEALYTELESGTGRKAAWARLEKFWNDDFVKEFPAFEKHPAQKLVPPKLPAWEEIRAKVPAAFRRLTYATVNSFTKENLDFAGNAKAGLVVVAVGGDRLSRGLTLEGLTASYFLRGARAFDTLMQMGRWFGYRPGYTHLCRVYAPREVLDNFRMITLATEELRREFSRMSFLKKTPSEYGLRVREPRADLLVTALNKMRRGETVRIHFAETLISSLDLSEAVLPGNYGAFGKLIETLEHAHSPSPAPKWKAPPLTMWRGVPVDTVLQFISSYDANTHLALSIENGKTLLGSYIESARRLGDLKEWTVVVVQSNHAREAIPGKPYRVLQRKRITSPPGRVAFQGVALGPDENLDLLPAEMEKAQALHKAGESRASAYRQARPSQRGLLLLYPIIPTAGEEGESEAWPGDPVIGVAVSLPSSKHDVGCDYVCNRRKVREIFGTLEEDLERDEADEPTLA